MPVNGGGFKDKVAVISGGASGIGLATAHRFRAEGARVVLIDVNTDTGQSAAAAIGGVFMYGDVGDPATWTHVIEVAKEHYGGIDIAFLNAGVTTPEANIAEVTDAAYRRIMGVNVDGVFYGARALVPEIASRGGGSIVVTASLAGLIAYSTDPVYTLTKHAVIGLVRALGDPLKAQGITINIVCPGLVDTPLMPDDVRAEILASGYPLMPPEHLAQAVHDVISGGETGKVYVSQPGREATAYRFPRIPGPRAEGAQGMLPPTRLTGSDQREGQQ